jgi:hypothetical protein
MPEVHKGSTALYRVKIVPKVRFVNISPPHLRKYVISRWFALEVHQHTLKRKLLRAAILCFCTVNLELNGLRAYVKQIAVW